MDIQFVPREEIDKVKWNSCVHYANNGNIFGYVWYLDHVAKEWDGLVEGDYESVFPLVWREDFWKRRELYQPSLMRELGVYSINVLSEKRIRSFLHAIPEAYKRVDIVLNEQNPLPSDTDFQMAPQRNYQLLLSRPYEEIRAGYRSDILSDLEMAEQHYLNPSSGLSPEKIAAFFKEHRPDNKETTYQFHALQRIMYNALHRGWGFASGVIDEKAEVLAVNFYLFSHSKVISLVPVESKRGRALGALTYLTDLTIRKNAGRPVLLDFNNIDTDDPWAEGFGAQSTPYYRIQRNNRWLGVV